MAVVQVWKCLRTGKLFESKAAYKKHRKALLPEVKQERMTARYRRHFAKVWPSLSSPEQSIHEYLSRVVEHQEVFWARARDQNRHDFLSGSDKNPFLPNPIVVSLVAESAQWRDQCSNTHSAPNGGATNWSCKPTLPRGYPGIIGHIKLIVSVPESCASHYHATTIFGAAAIRRASGGGGASKPDPDRPGYVLQSYSYGFTVFAHDVVGIWKHQARQQAIKDQRDAWRQVGGHSSFDPTLPEDWVAPELPLLATYFPTVEVCDAA